MIRNDPKIESTCGSGNVIGRGGDGDRARKTCDYDTHLTRRRSLTVSLSGTALVISDTEPKPWLIDSGCTSHFCLNKSKFICPLC